jgi:hypothetical protein
MNMKELTKKYRIVHDGSTVKADMKDRDMTGTITRTNDNYSVIDSDDFNEVANQAGIVSLDVEYDELPKQGKWVEGEKIYQYGEDLIKCIQGHYRTIYEPSETPALFNLVPGEGEDNWQENVSYQTGAIVEYNGSEYKCIQGHTSQANWSPENSSSLWKLLSSGEEYPEWQQPTGAHDAYDTGEIVTLNGVLYKSRIDANTTNPEQYNDTDSPYNYWDKEPFDS